MCDERSTSLFTDDQRGVAPLIGFILLFGILILLLSVYQVQIVPQQNSEVEFQHFQDIQNELVTVRNGISTAGQVDTPQFLSVKLGTNYQTRLLTVNPPSPTGTLQTSDRYNITITNGTEAYDVNVSTRFVEYQPGYYEIQVGSTWYEHSVLYLDERERGGLNVIEDQNLVTGSGTLRLTALQNEYQATGTRRATIELYPTDSTTELPQGELSIGIPTRLTGSDYWGDEFVDDPYEVYNGVENDAYEDGVHKLNMSLNSDDVELTTVGIRSEPDEGAVKNVEPLVGGGSGGGGSGPTFGTLTAEESNIGGGDREVRFSWDITGDFDHVTVETETDGPETSTDRSGSNTLSKTGGNREISATVDGPDGTEACEAIIGNGDSVTKNDFTCTAS